MPSAANILGIGDLGQRYQAASTENDQAQADIKKATADKAAALAPIEANIKTSEAAAPATPKLDNVPDKFQFKDRSPEEQQDLNSTLLMFAVIGGAMSRQPLTAAMNAYAGAQEGMRQGKQDEYKKQMEEFDRNLKIAQDKNSQALEEYRAAMEKNKNDTANLMNDWNLVSTKYNDTVGAAQLQAHDANGMIQHIESLAKGQQQFEAMMARMRQSDEKMERQGWTVQQDKDGNLIRVNPGTGAIEPFKGSTEGLHKESAPGKTGGGAAGNTRNNLVKAGANNSIARIKELTDTFGDSPKTSVMFGQHGDGVISRGTHALGQAALSKDQQQIDASYASIVDEAIPVFTGGLRGSDAFRKFLMGQLPGPGDSDETAQEKLRLFQDNINGTLNTFSGAVQKNPEFVSKEAAGSGVEYNGYTFPSQDALDKYKAAGGK